MCLILECPDGQYILDVTCYKECPHHFFPREVMVASKQYMNSTPTTEIEQDHLDTTTTPSQNITSSSSNIITTSRTIPIVGRAADEAGGVITKSVHVCLPCFSMVCLSCTGQHRDECTSCVEGYQLSKHGECMASPLEEEEEPLRHTKIQWHTMFLIGILVSLGLLLVCIVAGLVIYFRTYSGYSRAASADTADPLLASWSSDEEYYDDNEDDKENYSDSENHSIHIDLKNHNRIIYKTDL